MKIKRHIPNACEGIKPTTIEFNTKAELLNIPYGLDFRMDPFGADKENPYFKRYSISPYSPYFKWQLLMAEFNTDDKWKERFCVIGHITKEEHEELDLPIWEAPDE